MTNEEFARIVTQYEKLVFTVCYQLVKDYHEAQNLAQDTFFSAYRNIENCPPESYKPWLARIATNKAKDHLKSAYMRRVVVSEESEFATLSLQETPDQIYIADETQQAVREKILSLKEPYQKVSVLYFINEKNVEEIAQLLKRPKKTVQTQLYRAKIILQQLLKEERPA